MKEFKSKPSPKTKSPKLKKKNYSLEPFLKTVMMMMMMKMMMMKKKNLMMNLNLNLKKKEEEIERQSTKEDELIFEFTFYIL